MESIDNKVENHCNLILKTDAEDWDKRNKAILQLTELVQSYENRLPEDINNAFTNNVYRSLKEPIKVLILDLRSQQVRDTCLLLMKLADVTGDRMKTLLREVFTTILEGVKIPNKVMSGYIDDCIQHMIKCVTFKQSIPSLAQEVKESKSKVVREKCLEYISSILVYWDLSDKDLDLLIEPIKLGLEDASVRGREIARAIYLNIYNLYPLKALKIKTSLSKPMQTKLTKAEEDGNFDSLNIVTTTQPTTTSVLEKVSNNNNTNSSKGVSIPSTPANTLNSISSNLPQKRSTSVSRSSTTSIQSAISTSKTTVKTTSVSIKNTLNRSSVHSTPVAKDLRSSAIHSNSNSKSNNAILHQYSSLAHNNHKPSSNVVGGGVTSKLNPTPTRITKPNLSASLDSIGIKKSLQSSFNSSGTNIKSTILNQQHPQQQLQHKEICEVVGCGNSTGIDTTASTTLDTLQQQEDATAAAAVAIQARIRGTFIRRKSVVTNPFLQLSTSSPVNTPFASAIAPPSAIDRAYLVATGNKTSINNNIVNKNSNVSSNSNVHNNSTTNNASSTITNKKSLENNLPLPEFSTSTTAYMPPAPPLNVNKAKVIVNNNNNRNTNIRTGGSNEGLSNKPTITLLTGTKETSVSKLVSQWESASNTTNNTATTNNQVINKINSSITSTNNDFIKNNEILSNKSDSSVHFPKHLSLNMHVLANTGKDEKVPGIIKFIGLTSFSSGVWIGIELFSNQGKNNGIIQGLRYFECKPDCGIFIREDAVCEILNHNSTTTNNNNTMNNNNYSCEYNENYNKHAKSTKITAVLKLKISQLMEMLNEQIQIVENLEEEDRKSFPNSTITQMYHKKVLELTNKEQKLIEGFKAHLIDRLNE